MWFLDDDWPGLIWARTTFIHPNRPRPGFAESWKWCQVVVYLSKHVGQLPALHVNVGPVILIRTFPGHIHLLHFQLTATQLTLHNIDPTALNMETDMQIGNNQFTKVWLVIIIFFCLVIIYECLSVSNDVLVLSVYLQTSWLSQGRVI